MALTFRYGKDNRNAAFVRPKKKHKRRRDKKKFKSKFGSLPYQPGMGDEFYDTRAWRKLRWTVLESHAHRCVSCGAGPDRAVLHVDHIKPRSRYPELELDFSNLQILCEDCNLGKGALLQIVQPA